MPDPSIGNESASNNGGTGGDVFCAVQAGAIWKCRLEKPLKLLLFFFQNVTNSEIKIP
jgi:hypothetical protein